MRKIIYSWFKEEHIPCTTGVFLVLSAGRTPLNPNTHMVDQRVKQCGNTWTAHCGLYQAAQNLGMLLQKTNDAGSDYFSLLPFN